MNCIALLIDLSDEDATGLGETITLLLHAQDAGLVELDPATRRLLLDVVETLAQIARYGQDHCAFEAEEPRPLKK